MFETKQRQLPFTAEQEYTRPPFSPRREVLRREYGKVLPRGLRSGKGKK